MKEVVIDIALDTSRISIIDEMKYSKASLGGLLLFSLLGIIIKYIYRNRIEHLGGYGILSGLYFNNNARRCFKNPYDPPDFPGYCETIGTVVI